MGVAPGRQGGEAAAAPVADALGELRSLLFGQEARRIDGVEAELRGLAASRLPRDEMVAATAKVLAEALREAEIADHRAMADALAPLIVRAIKSEIRNSRDEMVEALYPIVGRLVAAAVADGLRRISEGVAQQVDSVVSARRWRWRFKAMATGRSVGEIALEETQRARVARVLCLERGSGSLIAVWPAGEADARSDLMSGLIAAITEFAATTFAREGGALRALDLGPSRVLLRSSATVIVAAECDGVLRPQDEAAIDEAFLGLLGRHERTREITPADLDALPSALAEEPPARKPSAAARWLLRGAALALAVWVVWTAAVAALDWDARRRIETALATARDGTPGAAAYPMRLDFDHRARAVALVGLAPSQDEATRLVNALRAAAGNYAVTPHVEIVPPAADVENARRETVARIEAEQRAALDAARARGEAVSATLARDLATARQDAADRVAAAHSGLVATREALTAALGRTRAQLEQTQMQVTQAQAAASADRDALALLQRDVARLKGEVETARREARLAGLRAEVILFEAGSTRFVDPDRAEASLARVADVAKEAGVRLRVVGHTDASGPDVANQRLGRARARQVIDLLTKRGVPVDHLEADARPEVAASGASPANRRVTFETPTPEAQRP